MRKFSLETIKEKARDHTIVVYSAEGFDSYIEFSTFNDRQDKNNKKYYIFTNKASLLLIFRRTFQKLLQIKPYIHFEGLNFTDKQLDIIIETLKKINVSNLKISCSIKFNEYTEVTNVCKLLNNLNAEKVIVSYNPTAANEFLASNPRAEKDYNIVIAFIKNCAEQSYIERENNKQQIADLCYLANVIVNNKIFTLMPNKFDSLKEMILYRFFQNKAFDKVMAEYFSLPKAIEEGIKLLNISGVEESEVKNIKSSPTPTYVKKQEKSI